MPLLLANSFIQISVQFSSETHPSIVLLKMVDIWQVLTAVFDAPGMASVVEIFAVSPVQTFLSMRAAISRGRFIAFDRSELNWAYAQIDR